MPKPKGCTTLAVLSAGALVAACQSAPARYAGQGAHVTYAAAATGAGAVRSTGMELYEGAGRAIRAPLHDFNMMQDQIPPVLLRAEDRPYDLSRVNSCGDVLNRVSELDLALGPDVDTPKQRRRTRTARGADFAASTALDAAGSAAEHFIPMRSTIKQITGAARYERHAQHAILAGETRRSFLKAVGMSHGCSWPAAPLGFQPAQVAAIDTPWSAPAANVGTVMLASQPGPTGAGSPILASTPAAYGRAQGFAAVSRTAFSAPVSERLTIPSVAAAGSDPGQAWRPPSPLRQAAVVRVSQPVGAAAASGPALASSSQAGSTTLAPWGSPYTASAAVRP